jgi:hypothetical protein
MEQQLDESHPTAITESNQIKGRKINSDKFLKLTLDNVSELNEEIQIIQIAGWSEDKNFECVARPLDCAEINEIIDKIHAENFPKAFLIEVEVKSEQDEDFENIKAQIDGKFPTNRSILLRINSINFLRKENENFKKIPIVSVKYAENRLKNSIFTTQIFLIIQSNLKAFDWNFVEFLKFEKDFEKFFNFAINSKDDFCLRLLRLFNFLPEVEEQFFHSVIQSKNFENFLAFLNVFDETEIDEEKIRKILKNEIFTLSVEFENLEVVKFLLKHSETFPEFFTLSIFEKNLKFQYERNFLKFLSNSKVQNVELFSKTKKI